MNAHTTDSGAPWPPHPEHRPDIGIFVAIAVLLSIGLHGFPERLHGCFIGFAVLLVISGFLISTIPLENMQYASFRLCAFHVRRVTDICPPPLLLAAMGSPSRFLGDEDPLKEAAGGRGTGLRNARAGVWRGGRSTGASTPVPSP